MILLSGGIMAYNDGAKKALENYYTKLAKQVSKPKRRNQKPEKLVEHECVALMRALGWDVAIYEAKGIYNPHAGRYVSQRMRAGTVDCQGVMQNGTFVAVEFKAPGKRSTFNSPRSGRQKEYLIQKIHHNAFAVVVDSSQLLKQLYETWVEITDEDERRQFLLKSLP